VLPHKEIRLPRWCSDRLLVVVAALVVIVVQMALMLMPIRDLYTPKALDLSVPFSTAFLRRDWRVCADPYPPPG
jgi:hypothetical protein